MKGRLCNMTTLTSDLKGSLLWPIVTHTSNLVENMSGAFEILKIFHYDLDPSELGLWPLWGQCLGQTWYTCQVWLNLDQGSLRYSRFFSMTLNSVTLTFDPIGSILGPNLIRTPSLVKIEPGVLEILQIFQYDLDPCDLDLRPHGSLVGPSLTHIPSLDEIWPRILEILKIFSIWPWPLWPWPLTLWGHFLAQAQHIYQVWMKSGKGSRRYRNVTFDL